MEDHVLMLDEKLGRAGRQRDRRWLRRNSGDGDRNRLRVGKNQTSKMPSSWMPPRKLDGKQERAKGSSFWLSSIAYQDQRFASVARHPFAGTTPRAVHED
jgi:hypothetical protein